MNACPQCQAENAAQARFCNQCGSRLQVAASGNSPRAYTPRHLIERVLHHRQALQGERKRVTVLFADIKGSTRLAQQAGAEAWHEILDRYFTLLSGAVHRFEGTVNQYTGDGIMALFGAPLALEDHAQRACLAALEAQAQVRSFADELRLRSGLNLSMRIGLNTGEVIVGAIGDDLRMDYTAQGLTVNLAARMEQICEPGRIYATRHTAALVEGYCRLRDLGAMRVAGSDAPVQVYEVQGADPRRTRLERSLSRGASPFVGREAELGQLQAALAQARGGQGRVLAVVGEAGMGKSRLCHEFAQQCERDGLAVHRASGVPYAQALPLFPVQTLLRSRLKLSDDLPPAELRRLVAGSFLLEDPGNAAILPQILDLLGVGESRGADAGGADRERVLAYLAEYLARSGQPQLLLVEDLHFADAQTLAFLAQLARALEKQPTLLLCNHRPEHSSLDLNAQTLPLQALAPDALQHLVNSLLGDHASLQALRPELLTRAGGNPFFVEEAVQALAEGGYLLGTRSDYQLAQPLARWPVADSVHALIAARIDRLPAPDRAVLHSAAVIGPRFTLELLAALIEQAPERCLSQLQDLQTRGLLSALDEDGHEHWQFAHPLIQELAYDAQLAAQRRALHARLAQLLEAQSPLGQPPDENAIRIAHHYACAEDGLRAAHWHLHAGRGLGAADALGAVQQLRAALRQLQRLPQQPELMALGLRARAALLRMAQFIALEQEEIEQAYLEAQRLAVADPAGLAELDMSYATVLMLRGQTRAAALLCARSLDAAQAIGAVELVDRFRLIYLLSFSSAGELREGLRRIDAAGGVQWREREIDVSNFVSRGLRSLLLGVLGQLGEAQRDMRAALAVAQRQDMASSWMHANLVDYGWYSGELADVLLHGREAVTRSERFGNAFFRAVSLRGLGLAYCLQQRYEEALPVLLQAQPLVARGGLAHQFEANFLAVLAEAYLGCGERRRALQVAQAAVFSAQASGSRLWEIRAWIALLAQPLLDAAQARAGLLRLQELIDSQGAEGLRPWLHLAQARWAQSEAQVQAQQQLARQCFARIGARAHAERLPVGMS